MINIPLTGAAIISARERRDVTAALEDGAAALMQVMVDQEQNLAIIRQQSDSLMLLMGVQNAMADVIGSADADNLTVSELRERLTLVVGEFSA